jgi:predicted nuclease of predicted toxin-antitoxin system
LPLAEQSYHLLFDENLAARLVAALADIYPDSVHVGAVGLLGASDFAIWQHARENGLVLVSKDEDFHRLSVLFGPPPNVIWLRLGNSRPRTSPDCCATDAATSRYSYDMRRLLSLPCRKGRAGRPGYDSGRPRLENHDDTSA